MVSRFLFNDLRVYFQHHRICAHQSFIRHRPRFSYERSASGADDERLRVDRRDRVVALNALNPVGRTQKTFAVAFGVFGYRKDTNRLFS